MENKFIRIDTLKKVLKEYEKECLTNTELEVCKVLYKIIIKESEN